MIQTWFLVIVLLLVLSGCVHAISINEVSSKGIEWVEIYNPSNIDLSQWNVSDAASSDTIQCGIDNCSMITNATYFLIMGNSVNITEITNDSVVYYYVDDSKIGSGLNDGGDSISFFNSTLSSNFTYNSSDNSLTWSLNQTQWDLCTPSPGKENNCTYQQNNESQNQTNATVCDFYPVINASSLYESDNGSVEYKIDIKNNFCTHDQNFSFLYWIEDLFGNVEKDVVNTSSFANCSKSFDRSWTPRLQGSEAYVIKVNLSSACDNNSSNDYNYQMIVVKGSSSLNQDNSFINITSLDSNVKWGSVVIVTLDIYRGGTSKYAIYGFVNGTSNVSEISTIHVKTKFTNTTVQIPIQLKSNCDSGYADGVYTVSVYGIDENSTSNITIAGLDTSICKTTTVTVSSGGGGSSIITRTIEKIKEELISLKYSPDVVKINEEFQSVVTIKNNESSEIEIEVYSYVFDGNSILSDGYDGIKWSGTWTSNKKDYIIPAFSSIDAKLLNRIKDDVDEGKYKFRTRIVKSGKNYDFTKEIEISGIYENLTENDTENITEEENINNNETKIIDNKITGNLVKNDPDFIDDVAEFFNSIGKGISEFLGSIFK